MKNKIIFPVFIMVILAFNVIPAQSDYEVVQKFKSRVSEIENNIRAADTLSSVEDISGSIDKLQEDYSDQSELIDKGLYPESFSGTLERLRNSAELRKGDFTQISELHTEMTGLRTQIDTLNRRNDELSRQFSALEAQNKEQIARLERMINQLRTSLQKRDQIVMNMIDSLLPSYYREGGELSSSEKQQVISRAERDNVIFHIKKAVNDNIRFLDATNLHHNDLERIKSDQQKFVKIWKGVGPAMIEIYSEKKRSTKELKEIDDSFAVWDNKISQEAWESIKNEFAINNINLRRFSDSKEFTSTVADYIKDEMNNARRMNDEQAQAKYDNFADSTWDNRIKSEWMPFLKDNNLMAEEQEDSIEVLLASWKNNVYGGTPTWIYILAAVIVIGIITFLVLRNSKNRQAEA